MTWIKYEKNILIKIMYKIEFYNMLILNKSMKNIILNP